MSSLRPSWPERILHGLIGGPDGDALVGDLLERFRDDLDAGMSVSRARRRSLRRALATCARGWLRRRGRGREGASWGGAHGTERRGGEMGELWRDLSFSARSLLRRPGLAIGIVVTLGLGVGATTAIYSVVDGVLLRPLPYAEPGRLVAVGTTFPGREWDDQEAGLQHLAGSSYLNFIELRDRSRTLSSLAAVEPTSVLLPDRGTGPELVRAARITPEFLPLFGLTPAVGRVFFPEEYRNEIESTPILLSHGAWTRRFGADPDVVGKPMERVGTSAIVVGVLPEDFQPPETFFPVAPEVWMPLAPDHPRYADRSARSVIMLGRLAPDVDVDAARVELTAIADQLAVDFPDGNVYPDGRHFGAGANGLLEETVGSTGRVLYLFLGAAALLFLIAVLNATTLLLARSLDRVRELGVRVALGAAGGRIVRLLLAESLTLAMVGGCVGAVLGYVGVEAFHRFGPRSLPRMADVTVDGRVLAFTLALTLATGVAAGLVPALRHLRRAPWAGLAGRSGVEPGSRLRVGLVAAQVGVAVLLLSSAGVLFHSFLQLRAVDPGFRPEGLVSFQVGTKRPGAPEGEATWQAWDLVLANVRGAAGVQAVEATSNIPFEDPYWAPRVILEGEPEDTWREGVAGFVVTSGYLDLIGAPIVRGRGFTPSDGPDDPRVVVVNEAFTRDVLGTDRDALGARIRFSDERDEMVIVGVVGDVVRNRPEEGLLPAVYVPYTQADWGLVQPVVRTDLPLETVAPALRQAVAGFSPVIPATLMRSLEGRIAQTRSDPRFQALLFGTFAAVALLLAAAGLYASLAHAVGRRRRELGIRMALGARRGRLRSMVLLQGARVAGVGLLFGLAGAAGTNRLLEGFLFGVGPADPATLAASAALLGLVAAVATYVPARQATAVDPVEVLKAE